MNAIHNATVSAIKYPFLLLFICLQLPALSQVRYPSETSHLSGQAADIKKLRDKKKQFITDSAFNKKLDSVLNTVSGVTYKDGKAMRTSASIDETGLNLNLNLIDNNWTTIQLSLAGAAEEKVVDIFSSGRYGTTLSGGLNFNFFPAINSAKAFPSLKKKLYDKMDVVSNYFSLKRDNKIGLSEMTAFKTLFDNYGRYLDGSTSISKAEITDYDENMAKLRAGLKKYAAYLPEDFPDLDYSEQQNAINAFNANGNQILDNMYYQQEVDSLNAMQLSFKFNSFKFNWVTVNAKINNVKYPMFDQAAKDEDYLGSFHDNYLSLDLSWNFLLKTTRNRLWIFPTVSFDNKRNFKESAKVSANLPKGSKTIEGTDVQQYKQISYYPDTASKAANMKFELPIVYYFSRIKTGIDFAVNREFRPGWDGYNARLGFFVPLNAGEEKIIIEPMIKISDIEDRSKSFLDEKISFGFNLTFTLPEFIAGKKK